MTIATRLRILISLPMLMLLAACSVVSDGGSNASRIRITQAVMSAGINDQGQATAPAKVFPTTTQRIYAVLNLEGVKPGDEISGKWFQTGVENVPAEGSEVHSSTIKLDEKTATAEGRSRVALFLPATTQGIPEDSWILRIYAGKTLLRTMAFVVVTPTGTAAPPASSNPQPPAPTQVPAAPTYTVVSGDTLAAIAQRFKPATEDILAYTNRLRAANNLTSDNLSPGQVLRLP